MVAAVLVGCGENRAEPTLTISFQGARGGPLKQRAADMRRAAQLELDAIGAKAAGYKLKLKDGPDPGSIASIDALSGSSQRSPGELMIHLSPPVKRSVVAPPRSQRSTAPDVWLIPPQKTASGATANYAASRTPGADAAITDSPLRPGTPTGRYVTAGLSEHSYPPAGSSFFEKFNKQYGRAPDRWAIYGYEAVGLVVDALTRLKKQGVPPSQRALATAALKIRNRFSPVGHYDVLPSGQTTLYVFQVRGAGVPDDPGLLIEALR